MGLDHWPWLSKRLNLRLVFHDPPQLAVYTVFWRRGVGLYKLAEGDGVVISVCHFRAVF